MDKTSTVKQKLTQRMNQKTALQVLLAHKTYPYSYSGPPQTEGIRLTPFRYDMICRVYPGWDPGYAVLKTTLIWIPPDLSAAIKWFDTPKRRKLPLAWLNLTQ